MKRLFDFKKLLFLVLIVVVAPATNLFGWEPVLPSATADSSAPAEDSDITLYDSTRDDAGDHYEEQVEDDFKSVSNSDTNKEKPVYFVDTEYHSCENSDSLKCPATTLIGSNYKVITDWINPVAGKVSCSVFDLDTVNNFDKFAHAEPIHTEVFTRKSCKENFSKDKDFNKDGTNQITAARIYIADKQLELKQQQMAYEIDYKKNGDDDFLDLADWLDALSTVNGEIIDIEDTLSKWEITTRAGYTIKPNEMILEDFEGNIEKLKNFYNNKHEYSEDEIKEQVAKSVRLNEVNKIISNSQYVMYLDFFTRASKIITEAANMLIFAFVLWNVGIGWIFNSATNKVSTGQNNENHLGRLLYGAGIFMVLFTGSSEIIKIQEGGIEGEIKEVTVKTHRIQVIIRRIYSEANEIADRIAKAGISSYLKGLNATSGVATVDALNAYTTERLILRKEREFAMQINEQCIDTYEISRMKENLTEYRTNINNLEKGEAYNLVKDEEYEVTDEYKRVNQQKFTSVDLNPYPTSEREAFVMMKGTNPYLPKSKGGLMKENFITSNNNYMSLSGCSSNNKKLIDSKNRLVFLDDKIDELIVSDSTKNIYEQKVEHLKIIHKMVWKNYAELGYISIAFLPATSMLLDSQGVLGDKEARDKDLNNEEGLLKKIAVAFPMMSLFGGHQIAQMAHNIVSTSASTVATLLGSAVPLFGTAGGFAAGKIVQTFMGHTPGFIGYGISYFTVSSMISVATIVVLITGSIIAFIILSLQKLWTFLATMFLAIHMFSDNQQQKIAASMGKMVAIAFKSVLLVFGIFLAIYSINLVESLQAILISDFFNNMGTINSIKTSDDNWFTSIFNLLQSKAMMYSFYGISTVGFMIIKIYVGIFCIFKLPNYFYDLLEVQVNDTGTQMMDSIEQVQEGQNLKGI